MAWFVTQTFAIEMSKGYVYATFVITDNFLTLGICQFTPSCHPCELSHNTRELGKQMPLYSLELVIVFVFSTVRLRDYRQLVSGNSFPCLAVEKMPIFRQQREGLAFSLWSEWNIAALLNGGLKCSIVSVWSCRILEKFQEVEDH